MYRKLLLAEVGILKDRVVTIHREKYNYLSNKYNDIQVNNNPIFLKDENISIFTDISCAISLTLGLVEDDYKKILALKVVKQ